MLYRLGNWHIEQVIAEREHYQQALALKQIHTGVILRVSQVARGLSGDGVIVKSGYQPVAIHTADCLALVLTTIQQAIALHISRKTLLYALVEQALEKLAPENITGIFLGPHICPRHFTFPQAGKEIVAFKEKFPMAWQKTNAGTSLSLRAAVMSRLSSLPGTVISDDRCTYETPALPSYRRWLDGGKVGQQAHLYTVIRPQANSA